MENDRNSSTQKIKNKLALYLEFDSNSFSRDSKLEIENFIFTSYRSQFRKSKKKENCDALLKFFPYSFRISHHTITSDSIPFNYQNLKSSLNLLSSSHRETSHQILSEKRNFYKEIKKIYHDNKKYNQSHKKLERAILIRSFTEHIQDLYTQLDSLGELPTSFSKVPVLRTYNNIQLFVHERGRPYAQSYSWQHLEPVSTSSVEAQTFNSLFSQVKKSKNRLFDQIGNKREEINVLGTYLAQTYELKHHSIILIASRNDFLPAPKDEIDDFLNLSQLIAPIFDYQLQREKLNIKSYYLKLILQNLPHPLAILTSTENLLLKNKLFTKEHFQLLQSKPTDFYTISITNKHKIIMLIETNNSIQSDIYHNQRISLLGELLNTLKHELSNPLFGLSLAVKLFKDERENILDSESAKILDQICASVDRCQAIINNFSDLYTDNPSTHKANLYQVINEIITLTKSETRDIKKNIHFSNQSLKNYIIPFNQTWFIQILFNLIINSAQAIKGKETFSQNDLIDIEVSLKEFSNMKNLIIIVSDTGPGVADRIKDNLFKPFHTTKEKGTGLGLSICYALINKIGGKINLLNSKSSSKFKTRFELILPLQG